MDGSLREELRRAFAIDDKLKADFERHQYTRAFKQRSADKQRAGGGLIHKTFQAPTQQPVQQSAPMDAKTAESWNNWLAEYVSKALEENNKEMIKATVGFFRERFAEEIKALKEKMISEIEEKTSSEIGALRADFTVDRTLRGPAEVIDLPKMRLRGSR
jgi:hypothetical protein